MKKRRVLAVFLAAAAAAGAMSPACALAASPDFARTQEEWARLQDNTIEYEELADLIHEYNATVQSNQYEYVRFRQDYGDTNDEVSRAYYDLAQDYYNEMSGEDDASSRMADLNLEIQARNMQEQGDDSLEDSKIYLLTYEQAEKNLVVTAQSDMISYYEKLLEREQAQADLEDAEAALGLVQVQQAAGTATRLEVLAAQESLQTAQTQLTQLDSDIQNAKETLQVLLGWSYSDHPEIGELPQVEQSRIDAMNPETDLEQALANNYTLQINKRKRENAKDDTTRAQLDSTISSNEKQIGASLSNAFKTVRSAQLSREQAQTEAQLEESNTQTAQVKLAAGMITQSEYDQQVHKRDSSQIAVQTAEMELLTAVENYEWAVKGLAAAE